jgi:hypothetical protein
VVVGQLPAGLGAALAAGLDPDDASVLGAADGDSVGGAGGGASVG